MTPLDVTDVLTATSVVSTVGFVITGLRAARLRARLHTDPLTGLGNRTALARAFHCTRVKPGRCAGVVMVDLNNFKHINDTYGHRVGDQVLAEVARRLRQHERGGQVAVRLSGDEFAYWLGTFPDTAVDRMRIDTFAAGLAEAIAAPMHINGRRLRVTASVGVGITTPSKPAVLAAVLESADRAMYRRKNTGRRRSDVRAHAA